MAADGLFKLLSKLLGGSDAPPPRLGLAGHAPRVKTASAPVRPSYGLPAELEARLAESEVTQQTKHYRFAHRWLPFQVWISPQLALDPDPKGPTLLAEVALDVGLGRDPVIDPATPLPLEIEHWAGEGWAGTHITLPPPTRANQAYGVAIVRVGETGPIRYLTFELGTGRQGEPVGFLCEWTPDRTHRVIRGELAADPSTFRDLVAAAVT